MANSHLESKVFLALLLLVTIAFIWILLPFYGAVFWAVILAIIFSPLQRRLLRRMPDRRNLATSLTLAATLLLTLTRGRVAEPSPELTAVSAGGPTSR